MSHAVSRRTLMGQLSMAGLLAACGQAPQAGGKPARIATGAGGLNMAMSELMRQQGFLESFGLAPEVIPMADGAKILSGVIGGSVDICPMSGFGQIFPAIEHGAELKIINASTLRPELALFSGKANVRTLKDLEGKVVGVGAIGSLVHQLTVTLLRKYAVDVTTVRFVSIGSNTDIFKGVQAGTVDGGVGPSALIDTADHYKVHALPNGDMSVELQDFTYQAGWTSARIIAEKRDVLVRVLAAYAKLFRFVEQPAAKEAFIKAHRTVFATVPEEEHLAEWNFLQTARPFAADLVLSPERVRYIQQLNIDFQVQKQMLPYERVVDASLAQEALKLLGPSGSAAA